jgi:dTDP-4-amino-4,6-dideoxygalactose transaminase
LRGCAGIRRHWTSCDHFARAGLYLIEDNCESFDGELNGPKTGTFGDLGTFSLFFSHHISTGEGCVVLTDDEEEYHLLRSLRAHGWARDLPPDSPVFEPREDDSVESYRFILPGYNMRPIELQGAIGRVQLKKLPGFTKQRRRNMAHFRELFGSDERLIIQRENGRSSSFAFTIVLNPAAGFERARDHGLEACRYRVSHDYRRLHPAPRCYQLLRLHYGWRNKERVCRARSRFLCRQRSH